MTKMFDKLMESNSDLMRIDLIELELNGEITSDEYDALQAERIKRAGSRDSPLSSEIQFRLVQ